MKVEKFQTLLALAVLFGMLQGLRVSLRPMTVTVASQPAGPVQAAMGLTRGPASR